MLQDVLGISEPLQGHLLRVASTFVTQMAATVASNLVQSVGQRTARWLLMCDDQVGGGELVIGCDKLGAMHGVRRAGITDALHQRKGCRTIRSQRGRPLIRKRTHLVALTGGTYGRAEAEYERLTASRQRSPGQEARNLRWISGSADRLR